MTHSKCGLLLLLAAAAVAACGGDPTESFQGADEQIVADPTSLFLEQGASTFVVAELHDAQGNQLVADFEPTNVGAGITVVQDTAFLETTNGTELQTRERFIVTGVTPGSTSFTLATGNTTLDVPVRVIPTAIAATFSNPSPAVNEPITVTLPADFKFGADAVFETALGPGFVESFSADSTSVTVLVPPGSTGPATLSGLSASFLPGVPLSLPTIDELSASATPLLGTDDPSTGPEIPVPAEGATVNFLDVGTFTAADITGDGGVGAQYYKFVVTDSASYHFVTNWPGASDVDAIVCFDAGCSDGAFAGSGITQPEDGTLDLTPGTYYFVSVLFAGSAPPYFSLSLTREPPEAPVPSSRQ